MLFHRGHTLLILLMHLACAFVAVTWLPGSHAQAGSQPPVSMSLSPVEVPGTGEQYVVAIISRFWPTIGGTPRDGDPIEMLRLANHWVVDRLEQAYLNPDQATGRPSEQDATTETLKEKFQKMRAEGIQLNGNDTMIVIFKGDDPSDIVATLRYVYPDESGQVHLEHELHWKYPHPELNVERFYFLSPYQLGQGKLHLSNVPHVFTQGALEIKNLAVAAGEKVDWVPILYYIGEAWEVSAQPRNFEVEATESNRELIRRLAGSQSASYQELGRILHIYPSVDVRPSEYALQCAKPLIPYYRRMGFELLQKEPVSPSVYAMRMSREKYARMGLEVLTRRPGYPQWKATDLDRSINEARSKELKAAIQRHFESTARIAALARSACLAETFD